MESKWYFFPGQSVENTKISDRAHALHLSPAAWKSVTRHLDRKKIIQDALDKEEAHRRALKEGSDAMTRQWADSIENQRVRKEQERREALGKKNEEKIQAFYRLTAEQEAKRREYVDRVGRKLFVSTGYPKELNGALYMSETLYERQKQKEFDDMIRRHEEEVALRYAEQVREDAEREKRENEEKRAKQLEEKRRMGDLLKKQMADQAADALKQKQIRAQKESIDRANAEKEEQVLKQMEFDARQKKRRDIAESIKQELLEQKELRRTIIKEEQEMTRACDIYATTKSKIDCMMKSKIKELRDTEIKKREEIAMKMGAAMKAKERAEEAHFEAEVAEKIAEEEAKAAAKADFQERMKQQRIDDRQQYLDRLKREKDAEDEIKRWEMLNRCKTVEVIDEHNKRIRKAKWEKILAYRRDLLEQIEEEKVDARREEEIRQMWDLDITKTHQEYDKMFFSYADEVLELARKRNRPTYPIERVIAQYKKVNNINSTSKKCRCCK